MSSSPFSFLKRRPFRFGGLAAVAGCLGGLALVSHGADTADLKGQGFSVTLDTSFPRLIRYTLAGGATLDGQAAPCAEIKVNGQVEPCKTTFRQNGPDSATYTLVFSRLSLETSLRVKAGDGVVELALGEVRERGSAKLESLSFPNNFLITLAGDKPDAFVASEYCTTVEAPVCGAFHEVFGPLAEVKPGTEQSSYFFCSGGGVAAGIGGNHIHDVSRAAFSVAEKDGRKVLTAWAPEWRFRQPPGDKVEAPWAKVFVTGDRNGDNKADWQDAALVYRRNMPRPFGAEFVRETVADQIAMNFASGAQQPFLRILDNLKRVWLATDGLGQEVLIKGFSSEGHDSANTDYGGHYNERAGGLRDFTVLLEKAHRYNARVGIHVNASEVYPEAKRYHPDILKRDAQGNPIGGWAWLDHSHLIDRTKDLTTGRLPAAFDLMRRELPKLDFVYVDTYWESGWPAWMLARKLNSMGLALYTEGANALDPWCTWSHQRPGNMRIRRFVWFSDRDLFSNDALLRGADHVGFLGWQNEKSFPDFLRCAFTRNLPAKFLQHFELLRWDPGKEAVFSENVRVAKEGEVVTVTQDGRFVMSWTGGGSNSRLCVPWDGGKKIYLWDESGSEQKWELPPSWKEFSTVWVYQLTDQGRRGEVEVPLREGRFAMTLEKGTPYVIYPKKAPAPEAIEWGEGSPVRDPGFDSHGFTAWKIEPAGGPFGIENDALGNARLVTTAATQMAAQVSQTLTGLKPGQTYAASVWVLVKGKRPATLAVQFGGKKLANTVERTTIRHSAPNDPRTGTNYQRLKVIFEAPASGPVVLALQVGPGDPSAAVEFDDVRVCAVGKSPETAKHTFWEDFEHVDMGYGPFTCCPNEHTHLSEANPPYTKDTLNGKFSLKSRDKGRVVRTLPSSLPLKPRTRYRLSCETLTDDASGKNRLTVESRGRVVFEKPFPSGRGKIAGEFATGGDDQAFVSLWREGGDFLVIDDLAIDELGPAPQTGPEEAAAADQPPPGCDLLLEETFDKPLGADWSSFGAKRAGSKVAVANGDLSIVASAHSSAGAERKLPAGVTAAECHLTAPNDAGETWGVGFGLWWPGGQALRVNLRGPGHCFGVDSTAAGQKMTGQLFDDREVTLRIRLDKDKVIVEARNEGEDWQNLAEFPRDKFPGDPAKLRLGKMHAVEGTDDNGDAGAAGDAACQFLRLYKAKAG